MSKDSALKLNTTVLSYLVRLEDDWQQLHLCVQYKAFILKNYVWMCVVQKYIFRVILMFRSVFFPPTEQYSLVQHSHMQLYTSTPVSPSVLSSLWKVRGASVAVWFWFYLFREQKAITHFIHCSFFVFNPVFVKHLVLHLRYINKVIMNEIITLK